MYLRPFLCCLILFAFFSARAQQDSSKVGQLNMSQTIINNQSNNPLTTGIYAQIDYNQAIANGSRNQGNMDVHRLVTFLGYRFNKRTHFVSEIEVEHVKEIYVEQAFVNYAIRPHFNVRAGLMLIPMGIVNEYHEPPTFNGVERPDIDSKIVPSTWREIGAGVYGRFDKLSLRYQAYVVNGFLGYDDGNAYLRGSDGFRKGRQKGAESVISSPNLACKVEHYGIIGLRLGLSAYVGRTQSTSYTGIDLDDEAGLTSADSTTVGLSMFGADMRYTNRGFQARAQFNYAQIQDARSYNAYTGSDLGSQMMGYYGEIGYDLFARKLNNPDGQRLTPFVRYSWYDTHHGVDADTDDVKSYERSVWTTGLSFHASPGVAFKGDYQYRSNAEEGTKAQQQINLGVGVWF